MADEKQAKKYCIQSISKGNKLAEGMKHLFGWKTKKNLELSFQLFYQCTNDEKQLKYKDASYSLFFVGRAYNIEAGVKRDMNKAVDYYEKSIKLGNTSSMYNLALIYETGKEGVEKNIKKSVELYMMASNLNDSGAMYNLALIYETGNDEIEKDTKKTFELYSLSAKLKHPSSINNLALIYEHGKHGIEKNFEKALELYQEGVLMNHPSSIYNLALIYQYGRNLPKDIKKAVELYQKAVKFNHPNSMFNLALIYENGTDEITKNNKYAAQLYQKASEHNHVSSTIKLSMIYEFGQEGIGKDIDLSVSLLFKAITISKDTPKIKEKFLQVLHKNKVEWKEVYHVHWNGEEGLNDQILTILLVSKFRRESKNKIVYTFVKGLSMKFVKYLCEFRKK